MVVDLKNWLLEKKYRKFTLVSQTKIILIKNFISLIASLKVP